MVRRGSSSLSWMRKNHAQDRNVLTTGQVYMKLYQNAESWLKRTWRWKFLLQSIEDGGWQELGTSLENSFWVVACLLGTAGKKAKVLDAGSSSPWKEEQVLRVPQRNWEDRRLHCGGWSGMLVGWHHHVKICKPKTKKKSTSVDIGNTGCTFKYVTKQCS